MKKLLIAVAISLGSAAIAFAADLPAKAPVFTKAPPPAPVYSWTGFYIGGNAGGAWGNFDPSTSTVFSAAGIFNVTSTPAITAAGAQSIKPAGFTGGFEAGYNWQVNNFVFGVEGDIEYLGLRGSANSGPVLYPCCAPTFFTVASAASTSWLATGRGRLGFAANNWLFYATGGVAFTKLNGSFNFVETFYPSAEAVSFSNNKTGYTVGAGVEAGLWGNWSVKAEYLYVNFGSVGATGFVVASAAPAITAAAVNNPFTHSIDLKASIARLGLNYRF
jgi:outer membrane immunogenic protein